MKKAFAILLTLALTVSLAACGGKNETDTAAKENTESTAEDGEKSPAGDESGLPQTDGTTVYVLGPTPDHGWTAQAGVYAQQMCEEITAAGTYKGVYMGANDAEEQVDQIGTLIANGDAAGVVIFALDYGASTGEQQMTDAGIPWIAFDRIIEETMDQAILNISGDNWQCGAGTAYYMQANGLEPGDTLVTLYGDNGIVCDNRQNGFEQFLMGELDFYDRELDETYHTIKEWTQEEVDALCTKYSYVCDWSQDGAYEYLEQKLDEIVTSAKGATNKLYVVSMDDEMTFGFLNLLEGNAVSDSTKADLEAMDVYISGIGGMEELYQVMRGESSQSAIADQYFDGLMSVYFSPSMMKDVINRMLDYLNGDWDQEMGSQEYVDVFLVDRSNADQYEGFTGH